MYLIRWTEGPWENWVDILPAIEGLMKEIRIPALHKCIHEKSGRELDCSCILQIDSKSIFIFYNGDEAINKRNRVPCGVTRLVFEDIALIGLPKIEWSDDGKTFETAAAEFFSEDTYGRPEGVVDRSEHIRRERNPVLRKLKIEQARGTSRGLACEACDFIFEARYDPIGRDFCEVHHLRVLKRGARVNTVNDLALLCSNCHRMIHRTDPMLSPKAFRHKFALASRETS